jgi:hypothetical protein
MIEPEDNAPEPEDIEVVAHSESTESTEPSDDPSAGCVIN